MTQKTSNAASILRKRRGTPNTFGKTRILAASYRNGEGIGRVILSIKWQSPNGYEWSAKTANTGYNLIISRNSAAIKCQNVYTRNAGIGLRYNGMVGEK